AARIRTSSSTVNRSALRGSSSAGGNLGAAARAGRGGGGFRGGGSAAAAPPPSGASSPATAFRTASLARPSPRGPVSRRGRARAILADPSKATLAVDLERQTVTTASGEAVRFEYDPYRKQALLRGLDDIEMTLADEKLVEAWEATDREARPWIHETARSLQS